MKPTLNNELHEVMEVENKGIIKEDKKVDNSYKKVSNNSIEKPLPIKAIYKLPELQKYNKDFVRVLLPKQEYKPSEAIQILKNYFKEQ